MREEIKESVNRMTLEDRYDVKETCNIVDCSKKEILKQALGDENIAEYVLQY